MLPAKSGSMSHGGHSGTDEVKTRGIPSGCLQQKQRQQLRSCHTLLSRGFFQSQNKQYQPLDIADRAKTVADYAGGIDILHGSFSATLASPVSITPATVPKEW